MDKRIFKINLHSVSVYFITIILTWIVAFFLLVVFQVDETSLLSISKSGTLRNVVWSGIVAGLIWALIFKMAQWVRPKIPTFFLSLLLSIFVNIISAYLLIYCLYHTSGIFTIEGFPETFPQLLDLYHSQVFYAILAYFFIVGLLIEIFYSIDQKFGKGVLLKFLLGRYYKPKEEERIFLFMDLKSSTYYAEKLGHFKYSSLIQDCFRDISKAVLENQAQIYQFVGDEVVLSWKKKEGVKDMRCVQLFLDFIRIVDGKKAYYQDKYGMLPVFKAGVHAGKVMVAQVGELKSEIAYHGDAINTASRIQGLCNAYQSRLLISGNLLKEFEENNAIHSQFSYLEKVMLTGKEIPVDIYTYNPLMYSSNMGENKNAAADYEIAH